MRDLLGYNVYLDGVMVASSILGIQVQLINLIYGQIYIVGLSALYDDGESIAIELSPTYWGDHTGQTVCNL